MKNLFKQLTLFMLMLIISPLLYFVIRSCEGHIEAKYSLKLVFEKIWASKQGNKYVYKLNFFK